MKGLGSIGGRGWVCDRGIGDNGASFEGRVTRTVKEGIELLGRTMRERCGCGLWQYQSDKALGRRNRRVRGSWTRDSSHWMVEEAGRGRGWGR